MKNRILIQIIVTTNWRSGFTSYLQSLTTSSHTTHAYIEEKIRTQEHEEKEQIKVSLRELYQYQYNNLVNMN
jgi:flagellin-specific chaperone FliS